jgi:cell division protein FtsI/penicillin-binding protein 2
MVNRVTSGRYTPGSVFKIVTAIAAIRYLPA